MAQYPHKPLQASPAQPAQPTQALTNSLANRMLAQQGQGWLQRGAQTMGTPSRYGPFGTKRSTRNQLLGIMQRGWGRSDIREAAEAEQAAQQAQIQQKAQALMKVGISAGMAPDQAQAWATANALGLEIGMDEMLPAEGTEDAQKRAERVKFLKDNPDVFQRIGQESADEFVLTGKTESNGMSLTVTPDGMITFSQGGEPLVMEPTTTTDTAQQEALLNAEESKDTLEYIMTAGGPDFLGYGPRIKTWLGGQLDKLGLSDTEWAEFAAERSAWANQILQRVMQYRKHITGVAGGPAEMKKIEAIIANPRMGAAEFEQAIREEIKSAQRDANLVRRTRGLEEVDWPEFEFQWGREPTDAVEVAPGVTVRKKGG